MKSSQSIGANAMTSVKSRSEVKLDVMWRFVEDLASLSTCRRLKVGCVIIRPDWTRVHAIGHNGQACGEDHDQCMPDRPAGCGCIHAEANALIKLETTESGLILLTTTSPCEQCAGLIINSRRIDQVIWGDMFRSTRGVNRLHRAGIQVRKYDDRILYGLSPSTLAKPE